MLEKIFANQTVKNLMTACLVADSRNELPLELNTELKNNFTSVSQADLERWVTELSFPRDFHSNKPGNRRAQEWVKAEFEKIGLTTFIQSGTYGNVIATLPGARKEGAILIGAHFDGCGETPGSDDNASAVSGMIGCAKALMTHYPDRNVCFVAFNAEEADSTHREGLFGSTEFVQQLVKGKIPGIDSIKEAYILEMIGYFSEEENSQLIPRSMPINLPSIGNFLGAVTNQRSKQIGKNLRLSAATYTPELPVLSLHLPFGIEKSQLFRVSLRSDHSSFWNTAISGNEKGIPAVMLTDTAEFRNDRYHTQYDTPDTLHYPSLEKVYQLVVATVLDRAE